MASLERARSLIKEERYQQAYDAIAGEPLAAGTSEGQRLLALACMRMRRYQEATQFYETVCDKSDDSEDWFNLAMARLLGGDAVHGVIALEEAKKHYQKGRATRSSEQMLFYFIGGLLDQTMWDMAKRYLTELAETYVRLGQTGDTFLYAQEIPYFSWFLNAVVTAHRGAGTAKAGAEWLAKLGARLDAQSRLKILNAVRILSEERPSR